MTFWATVTWSKLSIDGVNIDSCSDTKRRRVRRLLQNIEGKRCYLDWYKDEIEKHFVCISTTQLMDVDSRNFEWSYETNHNRNLADFDARFQ